MSLIYKIVTTHLWAEAQASGTFQGAPIDLQDGFIHFSTAAQVAETAARHFAGQSDLMLFTVAEADLGDALRWEPSRGGDLFPHLYEALPIARVAWAKPLPLRDDGLHDFSGLLP